MPFFVPHRNRRQKYIDNGPVLLHELICRIPAKTGLEKFRNNLCFRVIPGNRRQIIGQFSTNHFFRRIPHGFNPVVADADQLSLGIDGVQHGRGVMIKRPVPFLALPQCFFGPAPAEKVMTGLAV